MRASSTDDPEGGPDEVNGRHDAEADGERSYGDEVERIVSRLRVIARRGPGNARGQRRMTSERHRQEGGERPQEYGADEQEPDKLLPRSTHRLLAHLLAQRTEVAAIHAVGRGVRIHIFTTITDPHSLHASAARILARRYSHAAGYSL